MQNDTDAEIGKMIVAAGIETNYHDLGDGPVVVMLHGSGPGVTAWANWRLNIPVLAISRRVIAPDIVGFGYTERPAGFEYSMEGWLGHFEAFVNALALDRFSLVGNSFGGALSLSYASRHPDRVERLVLMGSAGVEFPLTPALEEIWGYTPSILSMRRLLDLMAFDRSLVSDELAEMRYKASIRPGVQEAYAQMFPAPCQRWIDGLVTPENELTSLPHEVLVLHGRDDCIVPMSTALDLHRLIPRSQLHIFGECGHWTQIEHMSRFNRLVADFLAESENTDAS